MLRTYVEDNDLGEVLGSRTPVELEEDQVYEPDILFVARERVDILEPKGVFGAPNLVIEILLASTVRCDRGAKFEAYERAGVRELWLSDPYGPRAPSSTSFRANVSPPSCPIALASCVPSPCLASGSTWPGSGPGSASSPCERRWHRSARRNPFHNHR